MRHPSSGHAGLAGRFRLASGHTNRNHLLAEIISVPSGGTKVRPLSKTILIGNCICPVPKYHTFSSQHLSLGMTWEFEFKGLPCELLGATRGRSQPLGEQYEPSASTVYTYLPSASNAIFTKFLFSSVSRRAGLHAEIYLKFFVGIRFCWAAGDGLLVRTFSLL